MVKAKERKNSDIAGSRISLDSIDVTISENAIPIALDRIVESPFEPQQYRRSHYKPESLESLGQSIKNDGLWQAIVVRYIEASGMYEIVFGERRWRGSQLAGLATINCIVKVLTDEKTVEMQLQENTEREELTPLDEAFYYKYYLEHFNFTVPDLMVKFAKDEKYIRGRLKLNDLIPEGVSDVAAGLLPLGHAAVIAKYAPDVQKEILDNWTYVDEGIAPTAVSLADLKAHIEDEIVLRLSSAPFDVNADDLHLKGLTCIQCPERSNFEPVLFAEDFDKEDRCLNRACFQSKSRIFHQIQRYKVAEQLPNPENKPIEVLAKEVPVIAPRTPTVTTTPTATEIVVTAATSAEEKAECEFSVMGIIGAGPRKNQIGFDCQNTDCPIHFPKAAISAEELEKRQSHFDAQIKFQVDKEVFASAVAAFNDHHPFWMFDDLVRQLIKTLWDSVEGHYDERFFVCELIRKWKGVPKNGIFSRPQFFDFVDTLSKLQQTQLLFIFTKRKERLVSGAESIAKSYTKLDYKLLEAETIYHLASDEFKSQAEDYLGHIRNGLDVEKPRFWTAKEEIGEI